MAYLVKKEILVRQNSPYTEEQAIDFSINWVNRFQENQENYDDNGNVVKLIFADLFDSRTKKIFRIYSNEAVRYYSMTQNVFLIVDSPKDAVSVTYRGVVNSGAITLPETPLGDIIGGVVNIEVENNVYDEVDANLNGNRVELGTSEHDGKTAIVSYIALRSRNG